jgi:hypothetical protein
MRELEENQESVLSRWGGVGRRRGRLQKVWSSPMMSTKCPQGLAVVQPLEPLGRAMIAGWRAEEPAGRVQRSLEGEGLKTGKEGPSPWVGRGEGGRP